MRVVARCCALLAFASTLAVAQERSISVLNLRDADSPDRIEVVASSSYGVQVNAWSFAEFASVAEHNVRTIRQWADSADRFISSVVRARPGERLRFNMNYLLTLGASFDLHREVTSARDVIRLFVSDRYVVNTVLMELSRARARSFITALRTAADHVVRFRHERAIAPDDEPFFEDFVAEPAELIDGQLPAGLRFGGEIGVSGILAEFVINADGSVAFPDFWYHYGQRSEGEVRALIESLRFKPARTGGRAVAQRARLYEDHRY